MNPRDAAAIVALRPAVEALITRVVEDPESFFPLNDSDQRLVNLVTELSRMSYELQQGQSSWGGSEQADEYVGSSNAADGLEDDQYSEYQSNYGYEF